MRSAELRTGQVRAIPHIVAANSKMGEDVKALGGADPTLLALYEVAVSLSNVEELHLAAEKIVTVARDLLNANTSTLCWLDSRTGKLRTLADTSPEMRVPAWRWPGQGAVGMAFESGQPVVVSDYQSWPHALKLAAEHAPASALAMPLKVRGRTLGGLAVATLVRRDFGPRDLQLMQLLAGLAAPTLELALMFRQLRGQRRARPRAS